MTLEVTQVTPVTIRPFEETNITITGTDFGAGTTIVIRC